MKQRILSAMGGLAVLAVALVLFDTIVPNLLISAISVVAVLEILAAAKCNKSKVVTVFSAALSAIVPFFSFSYIKEYLFVINYAFVLVLFSCLMRKHATLKIEQIAVGFMFSLLVPLSLSTLLAHRDDLGTAKGIFYLLVVFGSGWLSDTFAYFAGRAFGKHKLAPNISPKKTVEGAVGGILGAMITLPLLLWGYAEICALLGMPITVHYLLVAAWTPVFSGIGIMGDLCASVIKRQHNVKDFGSIMPGHGGVMDRFDSVLLIAPMVYIVSRYMHLVN